MSATSTDKTLQAGAPREASFGTVSAPATLTLHRRLPGPIERVWSYLVDSELRRQWLASGTMPLQAGASFEWLWRNDELSASAAERPAGFNAETRARCEIVAVEPGRSLSFIWPGVGAVTFQLDPAGEDVMLTVIHGRLPDAATSVRVGAGWHMHLDILVARVEGRQPPSFWSGWLRLRDEYQRRLAA